jgi:hypothetical protein
VLAALVALALSACGGGGQDSAKDEKVDRSARLANAFDKANINPLVGDWRRIRTCDEYVHQIKQAGLEDMVPTHQDHQDLVEEFGTGNAAQSHQDSDDPCQGVNGRLPHDHIFYKDGRFASVNQNGEFVDHAHYKLPDDRTLVLKGDLDPSVTAHFRFSNDRDTVTFDLVLPDMAKCPYTTCTDVYSWAVAVTIPGHPWHRVCQGDHKDNNDDGDKDELGEPCWASD